MRPGKKLRAPRTRIEFVEAVHGPVNAALTRAMYLDTNDAASDIIDSIWPLFEAAQKEISALRSAVSDNETALSSRGRKIETDDVVENVEPPKVQYFMKGWA